MVEDITAEERLQDLDRGGALAEIQAKLAQS